MDGKSRWLSKTYWGTILGAIAGILALWQIDVTPEQQTQIAGGVVAAIGVINLVLREFTKEPLKPIKKNKESEDV